MISLLATVERLVVQQSVALLIWQSLRRKRRAKWPAAQERARSAAMTGGCWSARRGGRAERQASQGRAGGGGQGGISMGGS